MSDKPKRGQRHPISFVAMEFGVDRMKLTRELEAKGHDIADGVTFREAFDALTSKSDREADRARQQRAEADTAEMVAAEKRGKLMLKEKHVQWCGEYGTQVRVKITGAGYIDDAAKKKLCNAIADIRIE